MLSSISTGVCYAESFSPHSTVAIAHLTNAKGEKVGTATITEDREGVRISIEASKLPPGQHGIHFHEVGNCSLPDFKAAGSHYGSADREHGLKNPKGPHTGDLPNVHVSEDGTLKAKIITKTVTLKKGKNSLLKPEGTAIVIHQGSDDQKSNPAGQSGGRIVCGVVEVVPET